MKTKVRKGQLHLGGITAAELAEKYGTPLYVMEEEKVLSAMDKYVSLLKKHFGGGRICYASKAFCCKEIYRMCMLSGLGADVVSGGELAVALSAGMDAGKIIFHGSNKTRTEIKYAVANKVGRIAADNMEELDQISLVAKEFNMVVNLHLRIKPGVEAHTHEYVRTGQIDSKFGFALENGEALAAVKKCLSLQNLTLKGIHCHIGSQIHSTEPYSLAAKTMVGFIKQIKREENFLMEELNLGGGFGIGYLPEDKPLSTEKFFTEIAKAVKEAVKENGLTMPLIIFEPGRGIVGEAGTTLYTVGAVKHIKGCRTYASVDGGMTDNPRYALYRAKYGMDAASKMNLPKDKLYTIAGKCCESGDLIGEDVSLQEIKSGDLLAVHCTGAYNYSMSSRYNSTPRPAVVMVKGGQSRIIVRGETIEDLLAKDI